MSIRNLSKSKSQRAGNPFMMFKRMSLACATAFAVALSVVAAEIEWSGAAGDGKWETDGNWVGNAKPTENDFAKFPSGSDDITVTISNTERVFSVKTGSSRTGKVTLTGDGLLEIASERLSLYNSGPGPIVYDVNVTNVYAGSSTSMYRTNTYLRDLYVSDANGGPTLYIREGATMNLAGNARAQTKYINMHDYLNQSLCLYENSSFKILRDLTLNSDDTLSVADNATLTVRMLYADADANISFTGGKIAITSPSSSSAVTNSSILAANPGTLLEVTGTSYDIMSPFSDDVDVWTLHGGSIRDVSGSDDNGWSRIVMPYTNATKTITGSGVLKTGQFYPNPASNLVIRLDGPDLYTRLLSRSGYGQDITFEVSGGSTVGVWGSNPTLEFWKATIINGLATFDTTDSEDGMTGRTIKFGDFGDSDGVGSDGILTLKGNGTAILTTGGRWSYKIPKLGVTAKDSVLVSVPSGIPIYSMGDLVLQGSAAFDSNYYMGHKSTTDCVKSLTMGDNATLKVKRYIQIYGDATLSGNATAVIRNESNDSGAAFSCANLSLSDSASLSVTGTISAATLSMSGNAHLAFTAGTGFTAGSAFDGDGWTMEITIPADYEAGIHPIVRGRKFNNDFAGHVTIVGATEGWSVIVVDGVLALYKDAPASGLEWVGDSVTSENWSDSANWNEGVLPTVDDKVAFGGADILAPFDDNYLTTVSGIVFRASAGPFVVTGSVDALTMTEAFPSGSRSKVTQDNATVLSLSDFDQEIAVPVQFSGDTAVLAAGGGAITLSKGITAPTHKWFVVGGEVCLGGTSETYYLAFHSRYVSSTSTLRLLPGSTYTVRRQGYHSFTDEANYVGRFVIEDGATMNVIAGDCASNNGGLEYVVDGTLNVKNSDADSGRLVAGPVEQYYGGRGSIYADSARSSRYDSRSHYINFGGTLKLYMNGNWYTATYTAETSDGKTTVYQNPNYPTRFRMTDGTTLGATKDWTYGPRDNAYNVIANTLTPADRASIMVGTVTVNTQSPKDDSAHTITFVDPLNASDANVVKAGAGTLVFNETAGYPSQIGNLTVNAGSVQFTGAAPSVGGVAANAGSVRFDVVPTTLSDITLGSDATASFASAPELSGTLTIASNGASFLVDNLATTMAWDLLATADEIVGPENATKWESAGRCRFKIEEDASGKKLYGCRGGGFSLIVR